ncbi:MAG: glycosyl hydrolase [Flammeovirgaceae bacterium]|nr:glycosyl hydrolase [Flammeovirgaceae bacterium]
MNLKKRLNSVCIFGVLLLLVVGCGDGNKETKVERPRDVWALRSVLDLKPRMLTLALDNQLWAAYDTQNAALYKLWKGKVNFDGPVYTTAHGPQPTAEGITYMEEPGGNPWIILKEGSSLIPKVIYKGHTTNANNRVALKYKLEYESGKFIFITEKPEFVKGEDGKAGLERKFEVTGQPEGIVLKLDIHLGSIVSEKSYSTDGDFTVKNSSSAAFSGVTVQDINGELTLNPNTTTTLTAFFFEKPNMTTQEEKLKEEEIVTALFAKSDCNTCHNKEVKTVGPSYVTIAEKYEFSERQVGKLVQKVINGGSGSFGDIPMTPHPNLSGDDAGIMVKYILGLDGEDFQEGGNDIWPDPTFELSFSAAEKDKLVSNDIQPGLAVNIYQYDILNALPDIKEKDLPIMTGIANAVHAGEDELRSLGLGSYVAIQIKGFINVKEETNVVFRIASDDGSRLTVNEKTVVDNDGNHGVEAKEGETILKKGANSVVLDFYNGVGGQALSLQWLPYGEDDFSVIPPDVFTFSPKDLKQKKAMPKVAEEKVEKPKLPGDGSALVDVHPSFDLTQARPNDFHPKIGGMDFLSDGRIVVSTWDSLGPVYIVDGVQTGDPAQMSYKMVASGLAEPLGLKVVDDTIFVMQKQELTKLIDLDGDEIIDVYETVSNNWRVSANFHEFGFGLAYKDGYFYATLATAIQPGGASTQPQIPDRGKVVKISRSTGEVEFFASGLRTPNGISFAYNDELFVADNQGDWLPASKIVHIVKGEWYGSRSVDFAGTEGMKEKLPVAWLPQDEVGNSPSQPVSINVGPYQNQMIHGEVTHGGIKRIYLEEVEGQLQGALFRFTQGLEAGVNRLVWGPDGALYIGGVGSTGNWGHYGKNSYGLQRLAYNDKTTFEMLAVRAKSNGMEIEFTEPLAEGIGEKASDYQIVQWRYEPTAAYGGPKIDEEYLKLKSISVSEDRKKVMLEFPGMKENHMIYIRLNQETVKSSSGQNLWTTESWYTLNKIPKNESMAVN